MIRIFLLSLAASCSLLFYAATCAAFDASIYKSPKPPHDAEIQLDDTKTAVQEIGPEGGTLSVATDDGTEFKLVIPPQALAWKTQISIAAIKSAVKLPAGVGKLTGAVLGPDGLTFVEPVFLHIKSRRPIAASNAPAIAFNKGGNDLRLTFSQRMGNEIVIPLLHFSGAALPGDWKAEALKAFEGIGARDLGDAMINGAEIAAQKAKEAGRDPDSARQDYLKEHAAYAVFSALVGALFNDPNEDPSRGKFLCHMSATALVGVVSAGKAAKALGLLNTNIQQLSPGAMQEILAALPEEVESVNPQQIKTAIDRCMDYLQAHCLATGDFSLLKDSYGVLKIMNEAQKIISVKPILQSFTSRASGLPAALADKAKKLLDQAAALENAVSAETYRDTVLKALGRCARYEVKIESQFSQTSYLGKGRFSFDSDAQAILSFKPAEVGDPIVDGKIFGETAPKVNRCEHKYERPTCAYHSSTKRSCQLKGTSTIELKNIKYDFRNNKPASASLSYVPSMADFTFQTCPNPGCPPPHGCWAAEMLIIPGLAYGPGDAVTPQLSGKGHPVMFDQQMRGHYVDPYGDDTFDDTSLIRITHIGTGVTAQTDNLKSNQAVADFCREAPIVCKGLRDVLGPKPAQ